MAFVACVIGGCGNDNDKKREYVEKGNAICADELRRIERAKLPSSDADPLKGLLAYFDLAIEVGREGERKFRELDPPPDLEAAHEESLELGDEIEEFFVATRRRLRNPDENLDELVEQLPAKLESLEKRSRANVRRTGLAKCLEEPKLRE